MQTNVLTFIQEMLSSTLGLSSHIYEKNTTSLSSFLNTLPVSILENSTSLKQLMDLLDAIAPNEVILFKDSFLTKYAIIPLSSPSTGYLFIGPYLLQEPCSRLYYSVIEQNHLSHSYLSSLQTYYCQIPYFASELPVISALNSIGNFTFGEEHFIISHRDIHPDVLEEFILPASDSECQLAMKVQEERYRLENEVLSALATGNQEKTLNAYKSFVSGKRDPRFRDAMRDSKNYNIILNTLCRKTAEKQQIHPFYLDQLSTYFAKKIEALTTPADAANLSVLMLRKYCMLIKNHSLKGYSPTVREVINYVNLNLSGNLGLKDLAEQFSISPSYLSTTFKKETGHTLTDYVNHQRINASLVMLNSMTMHIQDIAACVGILDVNYFTKLFKKVIGMTPSQYRSSLKGAM